VNLVKSEPSEVRRLPGIESLGVATPPGVAVASQNAFLEGGSESDKYSRWWKEVTRSRCKGIVVDSAGVAGLVDGQAPGIAGEGLRGSSCKGGTRVG
jgi:hypothetical protein